MSLRIGLKFKTSASILTIENWMDANCKGEWEVEIVSINANLQKKTIAAYFETEEDRDAFKKAYSSFQ